MKIKYSIFSLILAFGAISFTSCSDDKFTDSIFNTQVAELDSTVATYPLDKFLVENYRKPYNVRFNYKIQDIGSDMNYNLTPCSYDQSITLAVLCKYLWYDVYKSVIGEEFLKKYTPRIIQVIGSPAYNPTSGTIKLGTAEGGLKITLYNAQQLSPDNIDYMNEYFFKTMHHEFSHILHQNVNIPTDFALMSNSLYNQSSWQDTPDSVALGSGFTSPYASSAVREDWVETIANYIVKDTITWNQMLSTASYSWETVTTVKCAYWDIIDAKVKAGKAIRDSVGYSISVASYENGKPETYKVSRKYIQRDAHDYAMTDEKGHLIYLNTSGSNGKQIVLNKLDMVRTWLKTNFNYDLDSVRMAVQRRQWVTDSKGNFVFDNNGHFINNFTYVRADGTTLLDELRQQVLKYKK